jgi:hypothetical protein
VQNQLNIKERIALFGSLFNGRKDVYATRWGKGKKSGYMPAYSYDPYRYRRHKLKGGIFQNFSDKSLRSLHLGPDTNSKKPQGYFSLIY